MLKDKQAGGMKHTLRLMDLEREYLKIMKGCFNCRNPDADHFLSDCQEEGLLPEMPKILQEWKLPTSSSANTSGSMVSKSEDNKLKMIAAMLWEAEKEMVAAVFSHGSSQMEDNKVDYNSADN
ncbi:hypothetical protein C0995_001051 [Termitomyces sp. Mi166|nr:hypothetical protein C0995_001051 [Termitomyces sp. Mi166\